MKLCSLLFVVISFPCFAAKVSGDIECRLTSRPDAKIPFLTAHFSSFKKLSQIEFRYKKMLEERGVRLKDDEGPIKGERITTNHSPYKGNNRFDVEGGEIILPPALDNETLADMLKTGIGIGMGKGENAVVITSTVFGDGAGSHISFRLLCTSDLTE